MSERSKHGVIRSLVRPHYGALSTAVVLITLSTLLELLPHLVVYAVAVEVFAPSPRVGHLTTLAVLAFVGVLVRFILLGSGYVLSHRVAFALMRALRLKLIAKLERVPASFFSKRGSGDLKKTVVDDVANLEGIFAHNLSELTSGLIVPFLAASLLVATDWRLGLASLLLLPVAFLVQASTMAGYGEAWAEWHAAEARANAGVLEFIRGIAVLKAFNRDASSLAEVRDGILGIRDLAVAMTRRSMAGYATFFSLLAGNLLVVLPVGLWLFLEGEIARDELVLFVVLGSGLLMPLVKLLFLFGQGQRTGESLRRIRDVLEADELAEPEREPELDGRPVLCFERVTFTYPGRKQPALHDVSFSLEPGEITAVVGASGAGKTTLARLLMRAHDPDAGAITLGGHDLRSLSGSQRTTLLSHVAQDTTLFDGTIRENLLLAAPYASEDELVVATRAAHAHRFIERLPQGYDTAIGDRGARLSGGERQRMAIARALLKQAPIVVLDEVTANVDPESERGIQDGISALCRGRTILLVAHRLRTVVGVDRILVMDEGRVIDEGKHEELLERCSRYATLWRDQEEARRWTLVGGAA